MAVARVHVGADRLEVERDLARRVRAVDDRERAGRARRRDERAEVVDAPRRPLDMRAEHDARLRAGLELGERPPHERDAGARAHVLPEDLEPAVLGVAEQHLVARPEVERAHDRVQRRARVRREGEVPRVGADVRGEHAPRLVDQACEAPLEREELDGLALELELQALVLLENRPRAGAEGPMVQEHDVGVEQEQILHSA